jgi:hypothetical protein
MRKCTGSRLRTVNGMYLSYRLVKRRRETISVVRHFIAHLTRRTYPGRDLRAGVWHFVATLLRHSRRRRDTINPYRRNKPLEPGYRVHVMRRDTWFLRKARPFRLNKPARDSQGYDHIPPSML